MGRCLPGRWSCHLGSEKSKRRERQFRRRGARHGRVVHVASGRVDPEPEHEYPGHADSQARSEDDDHRDARSRPASVYYRKRTMKPVKYAKLLVAVLATVASLIPFMAVADQMPL